MKKIILSILAVTSFGIANAQEATAVNGFSEGDKFVEGSFRFSSSDTNGDSWAFDPTFGYMLTDKWAVGGKLNFGGGKNNTDDKNSSFGVTGFARYYFLSLGASKSFQAFGEAGIGYSAVTNEPNGGPKSTDNEINANISIGLNYFFTPNWAATFTLANILEYNSFSPENGDNANDFRVEVNLFNNIFDQPQFGLLYKW